MTWTEKKPVLYNILVIVALTQGRGTEVEFYSEGMWNHTEMNKS